MRVARTGADWAQAAEQLADRHQLARGLLQRHGPPTGIRPGRADQRFRALARAIAYQQLSGAAAATIWGRVEEVVGAPAEPVAVQALPTERLRAAGLSEAKARALHDLAARCLEGSLDLRRIARMGDAAVVEHLCTVRGIGVWTAQMFLLFQLGRTDVWPTGDLGVRGGWAKATARPSLPSPGELESAGAEFRPHRSVLAWWCWRELDATGAPG